MSLWTLFLLFVGCDPELRLTLLFYEIEWKSTKAKPTREHNEYQIKYNIE